VIAALAFVVILGYYVLATLQFRERARRETAHRASDVEKADRMGGRDRREPGLAPLPPEGDRQPPSLPPKYHVDAPGSGVLTVGDDAQVTINASSPPARRGTSGNGYTRREQRGALEERLAQRQRNLDRLQQMKAVYARGEEPLNLLNKIEAEEHEIELLRTQLADAGDN
jgi:hypothetical protein